MKNKGRCGQAAVKVRTWGWSWWDAVQLPRGLCSLCTQDTAALNPEKTLGLRSLFFQAAGSLHLVWAAVGEDEECCSGLHRSQSIHEAPGVQGALCSGYRGEVSPLPAALAGAHPSLLCCNQQQSWVSQGWNRPVRFKHSNYSFCHPQGFLMHHSGTTSCPGAPFHSQ